MIDRMLRVDELLKREIADVIEKDVSLPLGCLVSVNQVKTSSDLRDSKVYISILGKGNKHKILDTVRKNRCHIQKKIAKDVVLKYTPVLHFILDERLEKGDKVLEIISELENE